MKKSVLETIRTALTDLGYADEEVLAELDKEINRGADVKTKNAAVYESFHDILISNLSDSPATCGEIYDAIADELPEGIGQGFCEFEVGTSDIEMLSFGPLDFAPKVNVVKG